MTGIEAYQEYIRRRHNAFCKAVIQYSTIGKIIRLRQKWEREISLDYLMNEKFVQLAGSESGEEYPFTVCHQTVLLSNAALPTCSLFCWSRHGKKSYVRQPQRVIGACIGWSRSTVGRHIRLALQWLRVEMEVRGYE